MSTTDGVEPPDSGKWRFTWEAQSHNPTLKLLLFNGTTSPQHQCLALKVNLTQNDLHMSYVTDSGQQVSVLAPVPRVLIDYGSPLSFRPLDDHIEVKVPLLLPVDHAILSKFDEVLCLAENRGEKMRPDDYEPLVMATDIENLSSEEGVDFYCRSCSCKLTKSPIRHFVEMPSVNWQESADNWFGGCCCSFGGVSEKLVARYARSYLTMKGRCLVDHTAVIVCTDDLLNCNFPECGGARNGDISPETNLAVEDVREEMYDHHACCHVPVSNIDPMEITESEHFCEITASSSSEVCGCPCDLSENKHESMLPRKETELRESQRSFLNGFLGNVFMAKSYNLSATIDWLEFECPNCSALLGAYPSSDGGGPLDDGVRLYKCNISTDLLVLGSNDAFRRYTWERMFTNQLLQNAEDELSFRTVIKDMRTRSPVMQIVLLNPNSWYCNGHCLDAGGPAGPPLKLSLRPAVKMLFCDSRNNHQCQQQKVEEWLEKHAADEMFMLPRQIEALIECLVCAKGSFPRSYTVLEGFDLSSILR